MKRIISLACVIAIYISIQAQVIHWITFIDTTDPDVGQIDVYGREMLYDYFIDEINSVLVSEGYKTDIQDFTGSHVTPEMCKRVVNNFKITHPDDIIVFYYIGHGVHPQGTKSYIDAHPFPQLCFNEKRDQSRLIPLEWIGNELGDKGARLAVTIGMCCNNIGEGVSQKDEPAFSPNYGRTEISNNKKQHIKELFLNNKGKVIATSASPGQVSKAIQVVKRPFPLLFPNPADYRDRYTYTVCNFFRNKLDKYEGILSWNGFFNEISKEVDRISGHDQTPIHRLALDSNPTPVKITENNNISKKEIDKIMDDQKANTVISNENRGSWQDQINSHLAILLNPKTPFSKRQELESLMNNLFAEGAIVKFLAQDSKTVIDKSSVEDWLGILSTNPNNRILNVIVVEGETDARKKIKTIKVKEIYDK